MDSPQVVPPAPPPFVGSPPAPGPTASSPIRPRRWVAVTLVVAGVAALLLALGAATLTRSADDYPVVEVPGHRSMTLTADRTYNLYFDYPHAQSQVRTPPSVRVTAPNGDDEPLVPMPDGPTYRTDTGGREGRAFASVHPTVDGVYRIDVDAIAGSDPAEKVLVTVAAPEGDTALLAFVGFALAGLALITAGVVLFIVRAVRRRRGAPLAPGPTAIGPAAAGPAASAGAGATGWDAPDPTARAPD